MPDFFNIEMKIDVVNLKISRDYQIEINANSEYVYGIEQAGAVFINTIGAANTEKVALMCLDSTFKIINYSIIAMGRVDSVRVPISQIFKTALLSNATRIIVGHNHPSGVLEITSIDKDMTQKIGGLAKWFDIELIDSIVVNDISAISIRKEIEDSANG